MEAFKDTSFGRRKITFQFDFFSFSEKYKKCRRGKISSVPCEFHEEANAVGLKRNILYIQFGTLKQGILYIKH